MLCPSETTASDLKPPSFSSARTASACATSSDSLLSMTLARHSGRSSFSKSSCSSPKTGDQTSRAPSAATSPLLLMEMASTSSLAICERLSKRSSAAVNRRPKAAVPLES